MSMTKNEVQLSELIHFMTAAIQDHETPEELGEFKVVAVINPGEGEDEVVAQITNLTWDLPNRQLRLEMEN